ncbi:myomesin-2-like [Amphiura filiformis]|uniref:myomesin-2-like n=1 Tax=Amphiura filiformis TaxID=82378 RepID=UPI003B21B1E9
MHDLFDLPEKPGGQGHPSPATESVELKNMTSTQNKVGEHGATLELQKIKLEIPPGAFNTPVITKMSMYLEGEDHPPLDDRLMMTPTITICGPHGTEFKKPVTLHLPHSSRDLNDIQLWAKPEIGTEGEWEKLPSTYTEAGNAAGWLEEVTSQYVIIKVIRAISVTATTSGDQVRRMLMFMRPNPKNPSTKHVIITAYAVQEHWVDVIKTQRKDEEDNSILCAEPTPFVIESNPSSASNGLELKITKTYPESGWTGKQVEKISYKKLQKDGEISQCQFSFEKCGEHINHLRGKYNVTQDGEDLITDYNFDMDMFYEPDNTPDAPDKPTVENIDKRKVKITWSEPKSDGGYPITGYTVKKKEATSMAWGTVIKETSKTEYTTTDVKPGKKLDFCVIATNEIGQSQSSESSSIVTLYDKPDAPGKPTAKNIDKRTVKITWSEPKSDGGHPITGYTVKKKEATSTTWVTVIKEASKTEYTTTDVKPGKKLYFCVIATNEIGQSKSSERSKSVIPYDTPDAPGKPTVNINNKAVKITWTEPKRDGGRKITGYTVMKKETTSSTWVDVEKTCKTEYTTAGVKPGKELAFRVLAANEKCASEPSEPSDIVIFYDRPDAPDKPTAENIGKKKVKITWSEPKSDGGRPITGYTVKKKEPTSDPWITVDKETRETSFIDNDVTAGKEFVYSVLAKNQIGRSKLSQPSDIVMPYALDTRSFTVFKLDSAVLLTLSCFSTFFMVAFPRATHAPLRTPPKIAIPPRGMLTKAPTPVARVPTAPVPLPTATSPAT